MNRTSIAIQSDGLELVGELYRPDGAGPHPGLCICHGIPGESAAAATPIRDRGYAMSAEQLCRDGFLTLIFNFRGTGASQGSFDILGWTEDLKNILDYFAALPELAPDSLALLGFSAGASVSICVAAGDKRVSAVVSAAAPAEFETLLETFKAEALLAHYRDIGIIRDDYPVSLPEWLDSFRKVRPVDRAAEISPRPLLVLHGTADDVVPVSHAHQIYRAAEMPKNIVILNGANHRLRQDERAMSTAATWLKRQAKLG